MMLHTCIHADSLLLQWQARCIALSSCGAPVPPPCACARRDAEVLSLFAAIISKLREAMGAEVPRIFEAVFECTLQMITKNFEVRCALMKDAPGTHARTLALHLYILAP